MLSSFAIGRFSVNQTGLAAASAASPRDLFPGVDWEKILAETTKITMDANSVHESLEKSRSAGESPRREETLHAENMIGFLEWCLGWVPL